MSTTVRDLVVSLGLDVDAAAFTGAEKFMTALKSGATGVVAAVGAVGAALAAAAGYTANTADNVDELSQTLGVTTDELQRLGYAAGFSGLSMENVGQSMKFMAKRGVKDLRGELLRLADQFEKMPNGGAKTGLAIKKLGRQGADLIPMLNEGRAKLEELFAEAPVMDEATIRSGVELSDAFTRIQGAMKKFVFMVGAPLLKPLGQVATTLIKWFRTNEKLIGSRVTSFVEGFTTAVKAAAQMIGAVWTGLDALAYLLGGWGNVLRIATAGMIAFGVATNLPLAGLLGLLLVLEDIYVFFNGGKSVTGKLVGTWKKFIGELASGPSWKDSGWMSFFKWIFQMISDLDIRVKRLKKTLSGDSDGSQTFTSGERAENEKTFGPAYGTYLENMRRVGMAPAVEGSGSVPAGWMKGGATIQGDVNIQVDGSGNPKATADKIKEELGSIFAATKERYT